MYFLRLVSPSYAGEMSVTGSAKHHVTSGDDDSAGKNIGVASELIFPQVEN